jgi:hypothetical protein
MSPRHSDMGAILMPVMVVQASLSDASEYRSVSSEGEEPAARAHALSWVELREEGIAGLRYVVEGLRYVVAGRLDPQFLHATT